MAWGVKGGGLVPCWVGVGVERIVGMSVCVLVRDGGSCKRPGGRKGGITILALENWQDWSLFMLGDRYDRETGTGTRVHEFRVDR